LWNLSGQAFAYILLCEFGQILHPANLLLAMDMCEKLNHRLCGNFALYRVQNSYYAVESTKTTGVLRGSRPDISVGSTHSLGNSVSKPPKLSNVSRLSSPLKIGRMGVSQDVDSAKVSLSLYNIISQICINTVGRSFPKIGTWPHARSIAGRLRE
jgi:hypothetical protein